MRINNNIMAMNTHRQYGINNSSISKSTEKLSSGYRINRAGDDAAGLAISEKMRAQIRGLTMASKNSQDAISLVQTAEGALQESHNILQRMRELAVQSASDTNETSIDRDALNKEFQQLIAELDDTAGKTKFNDMGLIDGTYAQNITTASVTASTAVASAWAASSTQVGTYKLTSKQVTVQPTVSGVNATYTVVTDSPLKLTSKNGLLTVTFSAPGTLAQSDTINGIWNFNFVGGKFTATNSSTGEVRSASTQGMEGGGTITVSFGDLGDLVIQNNSASNPIVPDDFESLSGGLKVADSVAPKDRTTKDIVNLNGEEVELQEGQNTVVFKNSGISVNLANSYVKTASGATPILDGVSIKVEKNSVAPFTVQTGANQYDELKISIEKMDSYSLGVKRAGVANRLDASNAITQVNTAINSVSTQRAALGALQNRLNHKIANLDTSAENLQAAESRIRDVDMAKEMTSFTKNNILFQASTAMLAQANAAPQGVLQLLG